MRAPAAPHHAPAKGRRFAVMMESDVHIRDLRCDRASLCIHEAAHAVLCAELDLPLVGARVWRRPPQHPARRYPDGRGWQGKVDLDLPRGPEPDDAEFAHPIYREVTCELAAMYLAGYLAQGHYCGLQFMPRMLVGLRHTSDGYHAQRLLRLAFPGRERVVLSYAARLAWWMLAQNWQAVLQVAVAMYAEGSISAARVRQLVQDHRPEGPQGGGVCVGL